MAVITGGKVIEGARFRGATTEPPGQFATADYADSSVTSAKIADATIVAGDLADGAVTSAKILDGTIVNADIANATILNAKVAVPKVTVYQEAVTVAQFTDGGSTIGTYDLQTTIPAGARVLYALVTGITGFAGDTTATLQIGDGTTVARFSTGTPSVFSTASQGVDMGVPSGTAWMTAAKTPRLTITSGTDFTLVVTNAAGALTVTLYYLQPV